jgi:DNA-binding NarL/FixJ family response regulator
LGLRFQALSHEATRARWDRRSPSVAAIAAVEAQSPAEASGFAAGDLLEAVDNVAIDDVEALAAQVAASSPGRVLALRLRRGGEPPTVRSPSANGSSRSAERECRPCSRRQRHHYRHGEPDCPASFGQLTSREGEVLTLVAAGISNKGIARALQVSPNPVKFHSAAILEKLDAASGAEAVVAALRRGDLML